MEAPRPARPLTDILLAVPACQASTRLAVPARLASTHPVVPTRQEGCQEPALDETLLVVPSHPASTLVGVPLRPAWILVVLTRLASAQGHPQA